MTDIGRMRKNNEDRFLSAGRLAAVADGMGGHRAGEVASAIAMEELAALEHAGPWRNPAEAGEALRSVFLLANRRIRETAAADKELDGMGTTMVALLEDGDSVHLANVGDSRAYLLRNGELSQVTVDHTLVQELIDEGRLRPEEAERHPQRSIITRALGVEADVEVDLFTYKLQRADRLLLCTDGLSGVIDETRIRNVLLRVPDPQDAAEKLVALANEGGGPDNITVMVLDTEDRSVQQAERTSDLSAVPMAAMPMGRGGDAGELMTGLHARVATADARVGSRVGGRVDRRQPEQGPGARPGGRADRHSRKRRMRRVLVGVVLLAVAAGLVIGGRWLLFNRYWVGFDQDHVAVFRGVPGDVAGLRFSQLVERTSITRAQVPTGYATRLDDGVSADGLADARRIAACSPFVFSQQGCATGSEASPSSSTATTARATVTSKGPTATTARATAATRAGG
ncbi:MAG TPA: Stp1/IreP family PP2C-type Ser/Thr phosphatase [Actinomycetes bacterium]|jgi:protein phosphatase|nr:Stp1/IreP family PP2C-type Ser/Thr phosphatase [Actinomycetes bacterium]